TRKTSYIMAPFAILGGVVSFGSILGGISPGGDVKFTFEYLFIGYEGNELYFMLHSYLIIMGFMLVFQSNVNRWKYIWTYYLFIAAYFFYVNICVNALGVIYNTSGVSMNDWLLSGNPLTNQPFDGEYSGMSQVLNGLSYPGVMLVSYFLGWLVISTITTLQITLRDLTWMKFKFLMYQAKITIKTWFLNIKESIKKNN
ncbi:MAG: DUF5378 family protein, partial [Mycoplasmoidaceae bacterium]